MKILRILSANPSISQRGIAGELNMSLGKVNYMVNELAKEGLLKIMRFKTSSSKLSYMYMLTPEGIKRKMELTYNFLKEKSLEYERLKQEIEELRNELEPQVKPIDQTTPYTT